MSSPWISGLRSVALDVPDLARAEDFYTRVWHLQVAARTDDALYLRGTGADHHLLALHRGGTACAIRHVDSRDAGNEPAPWTPQRRVGDGRGQQVGLKLVGFLVLRWRLRRRIFRRWRRKRQLVSRNREGCTSRAAR